MLFQDYSKSAVKPDRYARVSIRHDVSEYLTKRQKQMMTERNKAVTSANGFSNSWSGFDKRKHIIVAYTLPLLM
jgi:hypothetical protein